ncbi:MAG: glycosyltransferase family 4 protein [Deltaproteobacteria bacterium]|nr:glycosyltransferase family 4 protein [Deltaproteobacteria bacterium]
MSIVLVTPGTGSYYCGSCIRDNALARSLRQAGREVLAVPLYLPVITDTEDSTGGAPIRFGGINVYLQQRSALFRHTPAWLDKLLDTRSLLSAAARRADMTSAHDLGALTVSMLRGEAGNQRKELEKLLGFLTSVRPVPSVVMLSNALLVGLMRGLRERLRVPVVVTLQGEDTFLDFLPEPHRAAAWSEVRRRIAEADAYVAVSGYYGDLMRRRLALDATRLHVVPNAIETSLYAPADHEPDPPVVGYLARLCEAKGLGAIVEAFVALKRRPGLERTRLALGGALAPGDDAYLARIRARLAAAGVVEDVSIHPDLTLDGKRSFLRSISVLSVPAMYGESFGLYLLEAWACGVPVVQPRVASFPELVNATHGGLLVESDRAEVLADGLAALLTAPAERRRLGAAGRAAVLEHFDMTRLTRDILTIVDGLVGGRAAVEAGGRERDEAAPPRAAGAAR